MGLSPPPSILSTPAILKTRRYAHMYTLFLCTHTQNHNVCRPTPPNDQICLRGIATISQPENKTGSFSVSKTFRKEPSETIFPSLLQMAFQKSSNIQSFKRPIGKKQILKANHLWAQILLTIQICIFHSECTLTSIHQFTFPWNHTNVPVIDIHAWVHAHVDRLLTQVMECTVDSNEWEVSRWVHETLVVILFWIWVKKSQTPAPLRGGHHQREGSQVRKL